MAIWEFKGRELVNCSCDYGCNCQFNALPDKGHCHAVAGSLNGLPAVEVSSPLVPRPVVRKLRM